MNLRFQNMSTWMGHDRKVRRAWPLLALLWLVSSLYLLAQGHTISLLLMMASLLFWGLHTWLSVRVTVTPSVTRFQDNAGQWPIWRQLVVILTLAAIANQPLPLWGDFVTWLRTIGEQTLPVAWFGGPGNAVANPVQYFVLPFLLLLVMGAKPADLGLRWGERTWRVCAIWLVIPVITWGVLLAMGQLPPQTLARRLIGNTFQNGFFEEFLFRGALYTRLRTVLPPAWALVGQALLFGLWHLNANMSMFDGDWVGALAWCVVSQAMIGLLLGILFQRTRSLIAPSVVHVLINALGQTFG